MNETAYFDLNRVKRVIEDYPKSNIFIIAGNLKAAKFYEERIREHAEVSKDRSIKSISNNMYSMDGLNFIDSIIFLCGYWWQNKNAITFIQHFSGLPKFEFPITHIPPLAFLKGGDKE
ncbi:hypothetical protein JUJ52_03810 [Virgibacillus sp. AGTR]|uniref:hypothetical protein n=1 Tax=Virgibacillus sp. AGTR TaxID=2812055 RepID=UPI001D161522|nr:hypothetical protein [Virgibacillus sp. AGTR]MCC2249085.1 hypothetical protein [Virgibacillus sp. AGTR]